MPTVIQVEGSNEQLDIWVWGLGEWSELQIEIPCSWYGCWDQMFFQVSDRHLWFFYCVLSVCMLYLCIY